MVCDVSAESLRNLTRRWCQLKGLGFGIPKCCVCCTRPQRNPRRIDPPPVNSLTTEVYTVFSWSKGCKAISNRVDAVLLARLRAGLTRLLKAYCNLLYSSANELRFFCKEELQTIERWPTRCQTQQDKTFLEVLPRPSRSLSPPPKRCYRSLGSSSVGPWRRSLNNHSKTNVNKQTSLSVFRTMCSTLDWVTSRPVTEP